jgi:hypothetical protein
MNNWKEEFKKILNANYVWTWDLLKSVEKFIEKEKNDSYNEWIIYWANYIKENLKINNK